MRVNVMYIVLVCAGASIILVMFLAVHGSERIRLNIVAGITAMTQYICRPPMTHTR